MGAFTKLPDFTRFTNFGIIARMKRAIARKRSTLGRRPSAPRIARSPRDRLLQLSESIGDAALLRVLETLERYFASTRRRPADALPQLQKVNDIRLKTLRALIFHDTLSSDEVRGYINRSRPVINKMAKQGQLLALHAGRALRFPTWQFDATSETGLLPHFTEVLEVMDASPFRKAAWFVTENERMHKRMPLDLLRDGDVDSVIKEAKSLVGS